MGFTSADYMALVQVCEGHGDLHFQFSDFTIYMYLDDYLLEKFHNWDISFM